MAGSLQDQLLNAGLSDKKKAKQFEKEKRKKQRAAHSSKIDNVDEAKLAAQQARDEKVARDRELNKARNEEATRKAIEAQIVQLIQGHKLDRRGGDVGFNFTSDKKIKKIYVTPLQQKLLASGSIAIASLADQYELIPAQIANKIAERQSQRVVFCTDDAAEELSAEEQDWYQDYEVPDDLMW